MTSEDSMSKPVVFKAQGYFSISDSELLFLKMVFRKRVNLLLGTMVSLPLLFIMVILKISRSADPVVYIAGASVFLMALEVWLFILFMKKAYPVWKDIRRRIGRYAYCCITSKSEFPLTGEWYFFLDHIKYKHKEVCHEEFLNFSKGDTYTLRCAAASGLLLDSFFNYPLL